MASRLPISKLPKMTLSKLPLTGKESKLPYSFRARTNKGVAGEAEMVELHFHSQISKKYMCGLCHHFLQHPCQVTCCGAFYCKECMDSLSRSSGKCASKKCGKNYSIITDGPALEELDRKMQLLKVHCLLKSSGCKWVGTIIELEQNHYVHVDYDESDKTTCRFLEVKCPNKCGMSVPHGKMADHHSSDCKTALTKCEFCGIQDSSHNIKAHQRMCLLMPVECPNKCRVPGIARTDILTHLENGCPLRLASCKYRHVGCDERVRFTDLEEHNTLSYQRHLDLMSEKLEFVSNENAKLRDENSRLLKAVAEKYVGESGMPLGSTKGESSEMSSAQGTGSSELADTLSLSSLMDTVAAGDPKPDVIDAFAANVSPKPETNLMMETTASKGDLQTEVKSGYESVIDELSNKMAASEELVSVEPRDWDSHGYMNVGLVNRKVLRDRPMSDGFYEILPDLCVDAPPHKPTNEGDASVGDLEVRYATVKSVKRKVAKLLSLPAASDASRERGAGSPDFDDVREDSGEASIAPIVADNHRYAIVKCKATNAVKKAVEEEPNLDAAKSVSGGDGGQKPVIGPPSQPATEAAFGIIRGELAAGRGSILLNHPYDIVKPRTAKPTPQPLGGGTISQTEDENIQLLSYHHYGSDQNLLGTANGEESGGSRPISGAPKPSLDRGQPLGSSQSGQPAPSGPPATSANAFTDASVRPRTSAISAPSLQKYNPKISEAVRSRRRRTPPLPPLPPELPPKNSSSEQTVQPSDSTKPLAMESASSEKAQAPIKPPIRTPPPPPTGMAKHVPLGMPLETSSCSDTGPCPVSLDASPEPFRFKRAYSEATASFAPLLSEPTHSPTMSEAIMNRFLQSTADELDPEIPIGSNGQSDSLPGQASSWHSTLVGAIKNSYRNLHRSLQSGSTYSLPANEASELKKELKSALKKRTSVLID